MYYVFCVFWNNMDEQCPYEWVLQSIMKCIAFLEAFLSFICAWTLHISAFTGGRLPPTIAEVEVHYIGVSYTKNVTAGLENHRHYCLLSILSRYNRRAATFIQNIIVASNVLHKFTYIYTFMQAFSMLLNSHIESVERASSCYSYFAHQRWSQVGWYQ